MVIGIVLKNGIFPAVYTSHRLCQGVNRNESILKSGKTGPRSILMTSSGVILSQQPPALAYGRRLETQTPLATAVIGRLTTSPSLTLPVGSRVCTMFGNFGGRMRRSKKDLAPLNTAEQNPEFPHPDFADRMAKDA